MNFPYTLRTRVESIGTFCGQHENDFQNFNQVRTETATFLLFRDWITSITYVTLIKPSFIG